jgi:hypothetical protein
MEPADKPPLYPVVPTGATAHQHKELRVQKTFMRKAWTTYRLVRAITCDQVSAAIDDVFYAVLNDPIKGLNGVDLHTLVLHIATTYAQISQPDPNDNKANFNTGIKIDPGLLLTI